MSSTSRPTGLRTPSSHRRTTLAVPTSGYHKSTASSSRRVSVGGGGLTPNRNGLNRQPPNSSSKQQQPKKNRPPRKSMLPRVGGGGGGLPVPPSPGGVTASTAASRRRSVGGGNVAPPGSARRQSLVPPPTPSVRTDPRPMNDKRYQQDCVKRLLQFLSARNYEYPLSAKSLMRAPSSKDFTNIVSFMLRLVDPHFQSDGSMKLEDEIAMNFKALGYPFSVSKTALVAAGSPHTWPSLLAALTWLMEHLQCLEAADQEAPKDKENGSQQPSFSNLAELEQKTDKAFFQYLGKAYVAFLQGNQQQTEQLEQALAEGFEQDDLVLEKEIQRITDLNGTIVEKINQMTHESNDLPNYAKKREDYVNDLEQFHDLIRQMDEHKAELAAKVKERTAELEETNGKLSKMNEHVQELQKLVETQVLSVDDLVRLANEQKGVKEALDRTLDSKDQCRRALQTAEEELVRSSNELEAGISTYNSKVAELALVPDLNEFASFKASFDKDRLIESDLSLALGGVDLMTTVKPKVHRCQAEYVSKGDQAKQAYQDALDMVERSQEAYNEAAARLKIVQDKTGLFQETLANRDEAHEKKAAVRQRELDAMEAKVASRRDPVALEEQIAGYERQCAELEALRIKHQEENIAKKKTVENDISQAVELMMEHDEHFDHTVAQVDRYWNDKRAQMPTLNVPDGEVVERID